MSELSTPGIRICVVRRWQNFAGYGFNLHSMKGRSVQCIGLVDENSPAFFAGLKANDKLIEVNNTNVANETHQQVVNRIKEKPNEVTLMVVDPETEKYYDEHSIVLHHGMDAVITTLECPFEKPDPNAQEAEDNTNTYLSVYNVVDSGDNSEGIPSEVAFATTDNSEVVSATPDSPAVQDDVNHMNSSVEENHPVSPVVTTADENIYNQVVDSEHTETVVSSGDMQNRESIDTQDHVTGDMQDQVTGDVQDQVTGDVQDHVTEDQHVDEDITATDIVTVDQPTTEQTYDSVVNAMETTDINPQPDSTQTASDEIALQRESEDSATLQTRDTPEISDAPEVSSTPEPAAIAPVPPLQSQPVNGGFQPASAASEKPAPKQDSGINLNMSAAEMRARLGGNKRRIVMDTSGSFKDKTSLFQQL